MLEFDYSERFASLISTLDFCIQLPSAWEAYFHEGGNWANVPINERRNSRMNVSLACAMCVEQSLPAVNRSFDWYGIYSKDFSKRGCGFVSAFQLYPEEIVRIVLPTLWVQVRVARTRRAGPYCYEIGGELIHQHQPSQAAFAPERVSLN